MNVFKSCSCCPQSMIALVAIILVLFLQTCNAQHGLSCSSSCGKIRNITYPFRLKGDPDHCGLPRYELDCVNNVTVLTLFSDKYFVQDINYNRYQIRLTDPAVVNETACPFPRYFLDSWSFTPVDDPHDYATYPLTFDTYHQYYVANVVFINCSNRVTDDNRYVEVEAALAGGCDSTGHVYAVLLHGYEEFTMMDMKEGCRLKGSTIANSRHDRNISYADILNCLHYGFWLSWLLPVICPDQCGKGIGCYINETTQQVIGCQNQSYCVILDSRYQMDECGIQFRIREYILQILGYIIRDFLLHIIEGFVGRILYPSDSYYSDIGEYIGQNVLPIILGGRLLLGITLLLILFIYKWKRRHYSMYENIENFLLDNDLNPIRYEYKEIKKMTKGFKTKLGQGGFGSVYKGKLQSRSDVAIKILSKSKANVQDFISEVATIGRIHHVNVVRLIGYCVEGTKFALVYEYMHNGSLDKYIFSKEGCVPLSYEKMYEISLGVAHGIAYLHQGCDVQILHFDVKPHNILLDDSFIPKVSDFGLAKLYSIKDRSIVLTGVRGTLGYMAPELFYKNIGGVSYKADVYSFGMLLMEMGSRRRNSDPHAEYSSQHYFPSWIYDQFIEEKDIDIEDASEEDKILIKKMFIIALWCIQLKPSDRPSMKKVVEMLEGKVQNLQMPPKPVFCPQETIEHDGENNSDQTSWSDPTSSNKNLEKTKSNHSLEIVN